MFNTPGEIPYHREPVSGEPGTPGRLTVPWRADLVSQHMILSLPILEVGPMTSYEFTKPIEDLMRIKKCPLSLIMHAVRTTLRSLGIK